ncbi:phosphoenolpyruvate carboxylase [Aestuariibaculum suncheonense]|uniref:Phosphoenolpyruvate carboxylase n=1 Tax=Aestuariibaculum suncheonense TaxID=1028745 RepID=A0A8J6ULZ2_9FLAO|nr:phosphoenolpyruvate carboxylase [Aestuariibaculum suncheonense]MBD0836566.1 phosphoenolpyruvate carboxylase [Aestuariibaculum suncheonense]
MSVEPKLTRFKQNVLSKYQIYNSIFMTLPFDSITKTGVLLPLFHETCRKGFANGDDPTTIVDTFFKKYQARRNKESQINLLFRFIQYIERQVVLFDAIEDAAFPIVNNMEGIGTLRNLKETSNSENKLEELRAYLEEFKVRIVLTAHPTQFYPGSVLGIITDLTEAIKSNDLSQINNLFGQLGKTPFFKHTKPTPYDEAISLIWYLENVFYHSFGQIYNYIQTNIYDDSKKHNEIINIGFWPGGDRDGNPFVKPDTTLKVARRLKQSILKKYYADLKNLRRKLTFRGVEDRIIRLETIIYNYSINLDTPDKISAKELLTELLSIRKVVVEQHQSLYENEINQLINRIHMFRYHFATLDIRQDSRIHHSVFTSVVDHLIAKGSKSIPANYHDLSEAEQIDILSKVSNEDIDFNAFEDEMVYNTLKTIEAIKEIQATNGEKGANRYIISNNQTALNVMQLFAMLKMVAFSDNLTVDVVPLFETITDLENAPAVMEQLYSNPQYMAHLKERGMKQTIMLGFSDGTKDGGYLMANWGIYKAKELLTEMSRKYDITAIFFDGRGGPPARGGGKTHQFYSSLGPTIEDKEVQLTIQGQTISSNFGTLDSSQYNLEQLISSGIKNRLTDKNKLSDDDRIVMNDLAETSYQVYKDFKSHPMFIPYLERMSTLKYYAKTNIGSRPSKRSKSDKLIFSDLRAIPFVGSWSQLKQNVPGFFGVGTALKKYEERGEFHKVEQLYHNSKFFKTLLENSMMSLTKSFFDLTKYMSKDEEFGAFWNIIYTEYLTTKELLLKLTGYTELMENEPSGKASIEVRESIVLPLLTIQQYALKKIQELERQGVPVDDEEKKIFEKIVTRSLFGNINASRNSA